MKTKRICVALVLALLFSVMGQRYVARADWKCGIEYILGASPARCDTGVTCGNYPPQYVITNKAFYRQSITYEKLCVNNQNEAEYKYRTENVVLGCCD